MGGRIDAFVAGAGTGGTMTGVGAFLKEQQVGDGSGGVRCVLADPQGSGLHNRVKYGVMFDLKEREGTRRRQQVDSVVEGIGCNRVVGNFEEGYGRGVVDDAVRVSDAQAMAMARWMVQREGVFAGSSSAVNCGFCILVPLSDWGYNERLTRLTNFMCRLRSCEDGIGNGTGS